MTTPKLHALPADSIQFGDLRHRNIGAEFQNGALPVLGPRSTPTHERECRASSGSPRFAPGGTHTSCAVDSPPCCASWVLGHPFLELSHGGRGSLLAMPDLPERTPYFQANQHFA